MQWYKHDTGASSDARIKKLIIKHGAVGYAIYFHCLELIAGSVSESNISFELEHDSEIIADNLKIQGSAEKSGKEIVEEIMRYIISLGLFEEKEGRIFCFKLLKRLDSSMTSNAKFRAIIAEAKNNHDSIMTNHDSIMTNHDTIMQDKIRIDKIRKEEIRQDEKRKEEPESAPLNADAVRLTQLFYDEIVRNRNPKVWLTNPPDLKKWQPHIEKMHTIDGLSYSEIEKIIRWVVADSFWSKNILSAETLRRQTREKDFLGRASPPVSSMTNADDAKKRLEELNARYA